MYYSVAIRLGNLLKGSYREVLEAVRNGEADAALINSDIASWMQDEIKDKDNVPLSVVYEIEHAIPIQMVRAVRQSNVADIKCYGNHQDEIVKETLRHYFKYTKVGSNFNLLPNISDPLCKDNDFLSVARNNKD